MRGRPRAARRRGPSLIVVVLAAAWALGSCSSGAPGSTSGSAETATTVPAFRYPQGEWDHVDAAAAGFDAGKLAALDEQAREAGSTCLVVTKDGAVVDQQDWGKAPDDSREAFSATKSVTSFLVGMAQDQGDLQLSDSASQYIPQWQGTPAEAVTIRDLLSNDSGRHWDFATDYGVMALKAPDKTAFAIGLGQDAPPGQVWAYNNSAIQTLSAVLASATGEQATDFAQQDLFSRIGMADSRMTTDAAGNTQMYAGLQTTCLDMARFGYLALRDGAWDGEQVVSSDYVHQATAVSSTPLNAAYGLLWWLNHRGPVASPQQATTGSGDGSIADGQLDPQAPDDVFWALGFNNQIVAVIPSQGVVAVRMGVKPPADAPFTQNDLTDGVLGALG